MTKDAITFAYAYKITLDWVKMVDMYIFARAKIFIIWIL